MHRALVLLPALALLVLALPAAEPEPKTPKPIHLPLNTKDDEDDPYLASSNLLYFAGEVKGRWQLTASTRRLASAAWPAGKEVDGEFPEKADVRSPCLTPEGRYPQYLYFATNWDPEKKEKRGDNYDIYVSVRQNASAAFTAPTPVQAIDTPADEMHPWLTANGKQLYFSRKTKEGWRVYVATSTGVGAGGYADPKPVDLPPGFHHATLTPDGKTMYLQGPLEKDRWGLFRSIAMGSTWSKPEALDDLNSADAPTGDRSPALSRDGKMLYFASDRRGGKGGLDLWVVPTAELVKK
jgi:hypothetical protein